MTERRIKLLINNKSIGFVEGECSENIERVLIDAYQNGWLELAKKIPSSKSTSVYLINIPLAGFYKEFLSRGYLDQFKALLVGSRCAKHIKQSKILSKKGFDTPRILASGRLGRNEFVVSQAVNGISFGEYLSATLRRPGTVKALHRKRLLFAELGRFIGRLHAAGVVHGDLRPNNLLLVFENSQPGWYVIDNERNKLTSNPSRKQLVKNLIQINMFHGIDMTMTDRRRFFKGYFSIFQSPYDARALEQEVVKKTRYRLKSKPVIEPKNFNAEKLAVIDNAFTVSEQEK